MSVAEMAVSLYAVDRGYLDDVAIPQIGAFEEALLSFVKAEKVDLIRLINETGDYNDDIENGLKAAVEEFKLNHAW
jgi:F-type H+/Na+-transporting ATPase subunit alpha